MKTLCAVTLIGLSTSVASIAKAETVGLNLYALGIKAGTITINATDNGKSYSVKGAVVPTALLKKIKDVGYSGVASGHVKGTQYFSKRYSGNTKTGSRHSKVKMHWNGTTPVVDSYQPNREKRAYDISPSAQKGTIDLLTSAYLTFKTAQPDTLCNATHKMFDGRRRSQISLGTPKISSNVATCKGSYKRLAGFSPDDMKEKTTFPFTIHYEKQSDGSYRFKEFNAQATFGKIRAIRK